MSGGEPFVVAIDGPSGVGKTTVARRVAELLGLPYLETGAMYRTLGLKVLEAGVDPEDREAVEALARELALDLAPGDGGRVEIRLEGRPVGERIRSPEVSDATSKVSVYPRVRERMVELQRACARRGGGVLEGRDIGTKVFPDTPHKFFLDAPPAVRVERRYRQLRGGGRAEISRDELLAEVVERDRRDRGRRESPLTADASYTRIDTSLESAEEVARRIVAAVRGR